MPAELDGRVSGEKFVNIIHSDLTHVYVYRALCGEGGKMISVSQSLSSLCP